MLAVLLDISFMFLFKMNVLLIKYKAIIIAILGITSAIWINKKGSLREKLNKYTSFIQNYCMILLFSLAALIIYSIIRYPQQNIKQVLNASVYYFYFFYIYAIILILDAKGIDKVFKLVNYIMVVWYGILIVQSILYSTNGTLIIHYDNVSTRNGIRITMYTLAHLMLLYNFDAIYHKRKHIKNRILLWVSLMMGMYCLIVVEQTRGYIISVFLAFLFDILSNNHSNKKKVRVVFVLAVATYFVFYSEYFNTLVTSLFQATSEYGYDQTQRVGAFTYFWYWFQKSPLFGFGFISFGNYYDSILRGAYGNYHLTDTGFVGLLGEMGIFAFVIYGILITRFVFILNQLSKMGQMRNEGFLQSLFIYILSTSLTLIMFYDSTALLFPLSFALFEYKYYKERKFFNYSY
ncbi:MAG: hypothetical protein K0S01_1879 [Herbinix sp.]|jgi:hypothetical protein|nr:hypothetical protein [Herbinix sp.]